MMRPLFQPTAAQGAKLVDVCHNKEHNVGCKPINWSECDKSVKFCINIVKAVLYQFSIGNIYKKVKHSENINIRQS